MKKILFGIALVFSLLVIATGYKANPASKVLGRGSDVPAIRLSNADNTTVIGRSTGHYTLVTFWTSSDGKSRAACNNYDRLINGKQRSTNVKFVAINMDRSNTLFNEIVYVDGLTASSQYRVDEQAAIELNTMFRLDRGMGSVLIGPDGRVAAFNPDAALLRSI